jgi:hypothetical protein
LKRSKDSKIILHDTKNRYRFGYKLGRCWLFACWLLPYASIWEDILLNEDEEKANSSAYFAKGLR